MERIQVQISSAVIPVPPTVPVRVDRTRDPGGSLTSTMEIRKTGMAKARENRSSSLHFRIATERRHSARRLLVRYPVASVTAASSGRVDRGRLPVRVRMPARSSRKVTRTVPPGEEGEGEGGEEGGEVHIRGRGSRRRSAPGQGAPGQGAPRPSLPPSPSPSSFSFSTSAASVTAGWPRR